MANHAGSCSVCMVWRGGGVYCLVANSEFKAIFISCVYVCTRNMSIIISQH